MLLRISDLNTYYGASHVLRSISLDVGAGEVVALLGRNGMGKSTVLKSVMGLVRPQSGSVSLAGTDITGHAPFKVARAGVGYVPDERRIFPDLSVLDNLLLGGANERDGGVRRERLERVYALFPILKERSTQRAGTMSGGQQRMLSLGLLLMAGPRLLMLDEPSLGLAPAVVQSIFDRVRELATEEGLAVLLLEQNVGQALRITDRAYVMRAGRVILEETAEQMRGRTSYWDLF